MKRVLVFGSFDLLHKGHLYFFNEARKLGDELWVVVARDKTIQELKKHKPIFSEKERINQIQKIPFVTRAVLGNRNDKYKIIEEIKPDIIALGYDQRFFVDDLHNELTKRNLKIKIIKLKPYKPHVYKSSLLKERYKQ